MSNSYLSCNNTYSKIKSQTKRFDYVRCNTSTTNNVIGKSILFKNGTFQIKPSNNVFIAKINIDNNYGQSNIFLDIDTSSSEIGDELILMFKQTITNNVVNLTSNFYLILCGEETSSFDLVLERLVIKFIFDGEKFVCSI